VTRDEATAQAASLNAAGSTDEHWLVSEAPPGEWRVVRVAGLGIAAPRESGAHTESRPRPDEPPDPRPLIVRNIPPYGAG
jgi:hypothetical protein